MGIGSEDDPSPTVTAADRHAVCYDARGNGETLCFDETQITSPANGNNPQWNDPCHPLASTARPPSGDIKNHLTNTQSARLTPTEAALFRLRAFQ